MPKKKTIKKKYLPNSKEKYMCAKHKSFFTEELLKWKNEIIKANKIEYEYDDNKNWIKQISYLDDKRLKVITRKIEYYN